MSGITIDGSTEPNGVKNIPHVAVVGANAGSVSGLKVAGGDVINGLTVALFKQNGMVISGNGGTSITNDVLEGSGKDGLLVESQNNTIENNKIGTDVFGKTAIANKENGIEVTASHNTISGNLVSGNSGAGILLDPLASNTLLVKNYIGTNAAGKAAIGNEGKSNFAFGALIVESNGNTIGKLEQGNLISGNSGDGIAIQNPDDAMGNPIGRDITGNVIQGNTIGTDISGEAAIPNGVNGIDLTAALSVDKTTITGNLISGNHFSGIEFGTDNSLLITSNIIGADRKISKPLGNGSWGIDQEGTGTNLTIGKVGQSNYICSNMLDGILLCWAWWDLESSGETVEGNFIGVGANGASLGNHDDGVEVEFIGDNAILKNSIYNNGGLGIDILAGDGNGSQLAPVLSSAGSSGIKGTVSERALTKKTIIRPIIKYTVQFFSSPKLGAGGHAQGKTYLGQITVTTNIHGLATFTANLTIKAGQIISATATDPNGNTSQFSNGLLAH